MCYWRQRKYRSTWLVKQSFS